MNLILTITTFSHKYFRVNLQHYITPLPKQDQYPVKMHKLDPTHGSNWLHARKSIFILVFIIGTNNVIPSNVH